MNEHDIEKLATGFATEHRNGLIKFGRACYDQGLADAAPAASAEPVAWAAVHFGGRRDGKIYTTCDTRKQIEAYIQDVHQSSDSLTLRARPLAFADAPVAAQAPQEPDEPLPPPGIHAAVHYAGWLRREAHRHQEPKAGALRQAARMLDVLNAECGRLHQELIDAQALQQDADPCPQCIPGGVCKTPTCGRLLAAQAPAAGGDAERVRNAAEILDTLTSNLVAGHPLRVKAAEGAKRAVADLYGVADQIDAAMRKEGRGDE